MMSPFTLCKLCRNRQCILTFLFALFLAFGSYVVWQYSIIDVIRETYLDFPYTAHHVQDCTVNVSGAKFYSQSREDRALYKTYFSSPQICRGVYVEIGALDGIRFSNTKFFEDKLNWTGVLIEAQPHNAAKLKRNRPRSIVIPEAVCSKGVKTVRFVGSGAVGGVPEDMTSEHKDRWIRGRALSQEFTVPCRPIGHMLRDSGIRAVDIFVVDVEGAELSVLRTMDWTIPVKLFVVEMGRGARDQIVVELLASHGYEKSPVDIRNFCPKKGDCANNQVFENAKYLYPRTISDSNAFST